MPPKKGSNAYKDEIVSFHTGINRDTKRIETVSETRGGRLTKMRPDGSIFTYQVAAGRSAKSEVIIVFGLIDAFDVSAGMMDSNFYKQKHQELKTKLEAMRMEEEAKADQKPEEPE